MNEKTFYDAHLHAFNLSHPSFSGFVRRLLRELPQGFLTRRRLWRLPAADAEKLRSRILFGTDFAVNLMWIDSYNGYLGLFSRTAALTPEEKHAFCSTNPERFLFRP